MATYGGLRNWAQLLDFDESARLLQLTLDEEGQADKRLTELAKTLNVLALSGSDEEELVAAGTNGKSAKPARKVASPRTKTSARR